MRLVGRSTAVATMAVVLLGALALPAVAKTDKQIAKAAALKVSDLGSGWETSKHVEEGPSGIPSCDGTDTASEDAQDYQFNSPDFAQGDSEVTNTVYVFPTVKDAKEYLAAFQDAAALDCLQDGLDEVLVDAPEATAVVEDFDVSGGPANDGVGFVATITVADGRNEQTLKFEAVAFRVGRGVTGITTQNVDEPLPITADLATTSIKRLKKGLK